MRIDVIHANVPPRGELEAARRAAILSAASGGTKIRIRLPETGPTSITGAYEDALAVPGVLKTVQDAEREGAEAVVINCTADTGVQAAREAVSIPVVGVLEASFHLAAQLSDRFAVLTFAGSIERRFRDVARATGCSERLVSVRSTDTPLELRAASGPDKELTEAALSAIRDDGARLLILGCTDFELAAGDLYEALRREGIEAPVLKPFEVGLHLAEGLIRMGLSHSKLTYPTPRTLRFG